MVVAGPDAAEVGDGVLHGDLDLLAVAGYVALVEGGEDADGEVHAGAGVAEGGSGARGRAAGVAGGAEGAAGGLSDGVEGLVLAIRPVRPEAFDAGQYDAGVDLGELVVAQAEALQGVGGEVLGDDVGVLEQVEEDGLALGVFQVESDRPLVGVEEEEVVGVDAGPARSGAAAGVAALGLLDLDDVGAEVGEDLGGGGAGFELGEVEDADVL